MANQSALLAKLRFNMLGQLRVAGFRMACLCALTATLHAERAPLTPAKLFQEADIVLIGQILAL